MMPVFISFILALMICFTSDGDIPPAVSNFIVVPEILCFLSLSLKAEIISVLIVTKLKWFLNAANAARGVLPYLKNGMR